MRQLGAPKLDEAVLPARDQPSRCMMNGIDAPLMRTKCFLQPPSKHKWTERETAAYIARDHLAFNARRICLLWWETYTRVLQEQLDYQHRPQFSWNHIEQLSPPLPDVQVTAHGTADKSSRCNSRPT